MRVGDVYKIKRMIKSGISDDEILKGFANDYGEKEIKAFIASAKASAKKGKKSKSDPLG